LATVLAELLALLLAPSITQMEAMWMAQLLAQLVAEVAGMAIDGDRIDLGAMALQELAGPGLEAPKTARRTEVAQLGGQLDQLAQGQGRHF
jgi:hypothetical protein